MSSRNPDLRLVHVVCDENFGREICRLGVFASVCGSKCNLFCNNRRI